MATFVKAKHNLIDGLFSRFMVTIPKDSFLLSSEERRYVELLSTTLDIEQLLNLIYAQCKTGVKIKMSNQALTLFDQLNLRSGPVRFGIHSFF